MYGARWQRARLAFLAEHSLCVECESRGKLTPANTVDHIKAHGGDWDLFWDTTNWQALCGPCHSAKTVREDGGFGMAKR